MHDDDISPSKDDPFGPPEIPTEVGCLHCGETYESYLIEWRVRTAHDGKPHGFWCCPTPGCGGIGFGFDILPTDPDYQDENDGWVHDYDEDDEDCLESDEDSIEGESTSEPSDNDNELPW